MKCTRHCNLCHLHLPVWYVRLSSDPLVLFPWACNCNLLNVEIALAIHGDFNWIALHYHTDWMYASRSCGLYLKCWKIWFYRHCQCFVCYCFQALWVAYTKVPRVFQSTGTEGLDPIVCNIASTRILAKMDKYIIAWGCHIHHPSSIEDTCWPGLANACSLVSEAL